MPKRWRIASYDQARVAALGRAANVPHVVAQLLLGRGISDADGVRQFLDVRLSGLRDPEELPGATRAAEILHETIRAGRRITIYGDYDADGMTATAILLLCLKLLGAKADFYIPNRIDEGYGLNHDALRTIAGQGGDVVVTVDCGITSVAEAQTARELGLTLIITDHHQAHVGESLRDSQSAVSEKLPYVAAIVHPGLPGSTYPFPGLCGAGVALKLAWALCQQASEAKRVSEAMRNFLMRAVGLAAIGTVADVVPLVDENRILVRHGLNCLRHYPTPGLLALEQVTELNKKPSIECEDVGFTIAPRLNAAGRLGQAPLAVELLTTESAERAHKLAEFIHGLNDQRQTLERSVYRAANKLAHETGDPRDLPALVLAGRGWHAGVIGIVAGRLAEEYHRPVVLISLDELGTKPAMGSGRSINGFNLHAALSACGQHLVAHGGHEAAAGLTIDERSIDPFRKDFYAYAERAISLEERIAELFVDAETPLAALTHQTVRQIEELAPFGCGNERPMLCTSDIRLSEPPRRIGATGRHLALRLEQHGVALRGVAFGGGDWEQDLIDASGPLAVAFKPVINSFRGRQTVEMHIADWRSAAEG
ncbi:MAG: single-stranded-DNA-specific exonuclease RecJ [Planctomycetes bacterium]|nr:single-stranded-DNA-specific exonuclease RecJ [Planctomycetota bacterium]